MSPEYPTNAELERITGQMNELANQLLLREDERSLILKKVGLILHGEGESRELERLQELAGHNTSGLLEGWIELHWRIYLSGGLDDIELQKLREEIRDSRSEDDTLRELPF